MSNFLRGWQGGYRWQLETEPLFIRHDDGRLKQGVIDNFLQFSDSVKMPPLLVKGLIVAKRLSPHFLDLIYDAALKSFWRKKALRQFLRRSGVSESFVAGLDPEDSKREYLDQLFPKLEPSERGQALIQQMARSLADQTTFPDLQGWEDSGDKIRDAKTAVKALRDFLDECDREKIDEREAVKRRKEAEAVRLANIRSQADLSKLQNRLDALCFKLGTQEGGYEYQDWFYDLMEYSEIDSRRPYIAPGGRQIDGSITIDGTTYLVELKFTTAPAIPTDIDSFDKKVRRKADNTMGIMVSMSSYNNCAKYEASYDKSPLLLLDHTHLYAVLSGIATFADVVRRVRRHSSQEGFAYLAFPDFGG